MCNHLKWKSQSILEIIENHWIYGKFIYWYRGTRFNNFSDDDDDGDGEDDDDSIDTDALDDDIANDQWNK